MKVRSLTWVTQDVVTLGEGESLKVNEVSIHVQFEVAIGHLERNILLAVGNGRLDF